MKQQYTLGGSLCLLCGPKCNQKPRYLKNIIFIKPSLHSPEIINSGKRQGKNQFDLDELNVFHNFF